MALRPRYARFLEGRRGDIRVQGVTGVAYLNTPHTGAQAVTMRHALMIRGALGSPRSCNG
jgi:hypothetical protein